MRYGEGCGTPSTWAMARALARSGLCVIAVAGLLTPHATAWRATSPVLRSTMQPRDTMRSSVTMGSKKVARVIKLALPAGNANPAPPVGPALGAAGVNIVMFCKEYNARTQDQKGMVIPAEITVYEDRSFTFVLKTPPASVLLSKYAKIKKGSSMPQKDKVGSVTKSDLEEIAKIKLPDLNTNDVQQAMKIVEGTARNMGITVAE